MNTARRTAFTLVELLVVMAIIALFIGIMIPAIMSSREVARRCQCQNNMGRLILAAHSYEAAHGYYPAGVTDTHGPVRSEARGMHHGWIEQLLPYIGERTVHAHIDFAASVYDPKNAAARALPLVELLCPSDPLETPHSSYAGCQNDVEAPIAADNDGVFFLNSHLRSDDITDGLAYTLFIAERRGEPEGAELGWMSGTRATLRNAGAPLSAAFAAAPAAAENSKPPAWNSPLYVGGFGSDHPGGIVVAATGDGTTRNLFETIDAKVLRLLANRSDGQLINPQDLER